MVLVQLNDYTVAIFSLEPTVLNMHVVFSGDSHKWTQQDPKNDLPHSNCDSLLCVEVEIACVV